MSDFLQDARSRADISIIFASIANLQIRLRALLVSYYKKI